MSYATQRPRPAPKNGRDGPAYRAACAVVRERAQRGEHCYFEGRHPECPGGYFDLALPHNHRHAFTAHHIRRLMDGGVPVPDPRLMYPAHRGCNARDGLQAQNALRTGTSTTTQAPPTPTAALMVERTSRAW